MKKEVGKLVKHSGIYGLGTVLSKSVGFFMIPLYTHYLRPADYGVLELLDLTLFFSGIFAMMGISEAFFRFFVAADSEHAKREVTTTALASVAGISFLVLVLMQSLAGKLSLIAFGNISYTPFVRVVAFTLFFSNLTEVPLAYFRARQRTILFITIGVSRTFLNASLIVLAVAILHRGVQGVVYANLVANGFAGLGLMTALLYQARGKLALARFREMFIYGAPLIVQSLSSFVLVFSDRFFLRHYSTLFEVGVYGLGYKLASVVSLVVTGPFAMAWAWQQFELAKQDNAPQAFARVQTYQFFVSILVGLAVSIMAKDLLRLMTPASYWSAAPIVPIIALCYIFGNLRSVLHTGILVKKSTHQLAWISVMGAIANLALNFVLIPRFHAMGAAVATLLSYTVALALSFLIAQRVFPVRYEYGRVAAFLLLSILFYELGTLFSLGPLQSILAKCGLLVAFLAVSITLLSGDELKMLQELVRGISNQVRGVTTETIR